MFSRHPPKLLLARHLSSAAGGRPIPTINVKEKSVQVKVVFHGPALSGKTTNLEALHELADPRSVTDLIQVKTEGDRTLFFDLLPMAFGDVGGLAFRVRVFTVPGQSFHRATRRLVLRDADAIVFVGDLGPDRARDNAESLRDLASSLAANGIGPGAVPIVLQGNKADVTGAMSPDAFLRSLELDGLGPYRPDAHPNPVVASALSGEGVVATFGLALRRVLMAAHERATTQRAASPWAEFVGAMDAELVGWRGRRRATRSDAGSAGIPGPAAEPIPAEALLELSVQRSVVLAESLGDQRILRAELLQRVKELETIDRLSRALAPGLDSARVARSVVQAARTALPGGSASVLIEETPGTLAEAALAGITIDALLDAGRREFAEHMLDARAPHVFSADETARLFHGAATGRAGGGPQAMALAPLRVGPSRRGLICVYGDRSDRTEPAGVIRFLSAVSSAAALALDNAHQRAQIVAHGEHLATEVAARTADLRRAHEEIVAMSRMKDRILATVNHELRTPVAKLLASAQVLERAQGQAPPPPGLLPGLVRHARHLGRIIDQAVCAHSLLSRPVGEGGEDDAGEVTNVADALGAMVLSCQGAAEERGVVIRVEAVPQDVAWVAAGSGSLTLALAPLLDNAVKFTAAGSEVTVRVVQHDRDRVRILVMDCGPGIPAGDCERVFLELDQGSGDGLTDKPAGLGLGLAIARRAARRLGGDVGVDPRATRCGATFWLDLRLAMHPVAVPS